MAPLFVVDADGWLSEACGQTVKREKSSPQGASSSWPGGHAKGILLHYTAGCGENLLGLYQGQGYTEANYHIGGSGTIYGYLPLNRSGDHAYAASQFGYGIEHAALPGTCNLNDKQYRSSLNLSAALVAYLKSKHGHEVPLRHVGGCDLSSAGFKEHKDGAIPQHCDWNPGVHVDDPGTRWGWSKYLDGVAELLGGEDMNDTEHAWLENTTNRLNGLVAGMKGDAEPPADATGERKAGWNAGNVVRNVRQWQLGYTQRVQGKEKPTDAEQAQGWVAADGVLEAAAAGGGEGAPVSAEGAHSHEARS